MLEEEEEEEAEEGRRGEDCWREVPGAILPAFCWDGERPVSDGQRSVPRGTAGSAAGTEGGTGGDEADSGPQGTARQWQGAQILHCCRSLPPPPPQRTSEAKKQRFRRSFSEERNKEYHLGWISPKEKNLPHRNNPFYYTDKMHLTQIIVRLPGINYIKIKVDLCR